MRIAVFIFLSVSTFLIGFSEMPWWALAFPALLGGLLQLTHKRAFIDAFVAAFLVWAIVAATQDFTTGLRISARVAGVFHLPFSFLAFVMTGLIAGLVAGLAGICGRSLRLLVPGAHMPIGR